VVLANRFKGLRAEKGYTQKDVADLLGISPTAVASWEQERNNPNLDTLVRIAKLFDVSNAAGEEKHPRGCLEILHCRIAKRAISALSLPEVNPRLSVFFFMASIPLPGKAP